MGVLFDPILDFAIIDLDAEKMRCVCVCVNWQKQMWRQSIVELKPGHIVFICVLTMIQFSMGFLFVISLRT